VLSSKDDEPMKLPPICLSLAISACLVLPGEVSAQSPEPASLRSSQQMIVVTTPDWSAVEGRLQRYERALP